MQETPCDAGGKENFAGRPALPTPGRRLPRGGAGMQCMQAKKGKGRQTVAPKSLKPVKDTSEAAWRPLVSLADLAAVALLDGCQLDSWHDLRLNEGHVHEAHVRDIPGVSEEALHHVRCLARANHEHALPELTTRFETLGYGVQDMWMTLAWIRHCWKGMRNTLLVFWGT